MTEWKFLQVQVGDDWAMGKKTKFKLHDVADGTILYNFVLDGQNRFANLKNRKAAYFFHRLVDSGAIGWNGRSVRFSNDKVSNFYQKMIDSGYLIWETV